MSNFRIPLEDIEFNEEYGLNLLVQTGAGFGDWVTPEISVEEVTPETFDGGPFAVTLHGGDEFSMDFEAKNLANREIYAPLALVIEGPTGTEWTTTTDEIKAGEPEPAFVDTSGEYLVAVFDELGTIGPGATHDLGMRIQFSEAIEPGDYEFRAVVVWSEIANDTTAILEAAGIP